MSQQSEPRRRPARRTVLAGLAAAGVAAVGASPAGAVGQRAGSVPSARTLEDPDLGPNVTVFSPEMSATEIQARLDEVFAEQEENQFGRSRYALLFKPGSYQVDANVGFYTHVAGLGRSPDDTTIEGAVHAEADWFDGNATQNFWRAAENLCVNPTDGADRWAVSQAAPYRRMHVRGDLQLDDGGWSSGGLLADCVVDGEVRSGTQQQWLSRNSAWGGWDGENWNMVFVGVENPPAGEFPDPPYTVVDTTPVVREKPFLYIDQEAGEAGEFAVFVPALRTDSRGASWSSGAPEGESIPLSAFLVATPETSVAEINAALADGSHLLLTPGVYEISETIEVARADTVVLGLGLATLVPVAGQPAVRVGDVGGVKLAGVLVDAGAESSPTLVEIGSEGAADQSDNPVSLHDLFLRVGGAHAGAATNSLVINTGSTIGDHSWIWRGDHGTGIGWETNPAETGLVVNADDVVFYGLFAEHYQGYQVVWNGERGRTYFFQNEMPYDPPDQDAWRNGQTRGFAAYKVDDAVTTHEAWGLGSYCFFEKNPDVVAERAFEVPRAEGVALHHMVTVSLGGGTGRIEHVVNDTGDPVGPGADEETFLVAYP